MSIRKPILTLLLFSLLISLAAGCVESKKLPPKEYLTRINGLDGEFYMTEKPSGIRTDITLRYDAKLSCYIASSKKLSGEPKIYLHKIGEALVAFIQLSDRKTYSIARAEVSKTQLVFYVINTEYFKRNKEAIPSISESGGTFTIDATSEQLALFFRLHELNEKIWDTREPAIYNRIGT